MSQAVEHRGVSGLAALRADLARLPAYVEPPRVVVQPKANWTAIVTILSVVSVTALCFGLQFYAPNAPSPTPLPQAMPEPPARPLTRQQAWQDLPLPDGVHLHAPPPAPKAPLHPARLPRPSNG